jgi:SAM-dependent methyltransferase
LAGMAPAGMAAPAAAVLPEDTAPMRRLFRPCAAMLLSVGMLLAPRAIAAEDPPRITEETPYVPSPRIVVETMLRMAGVNSKDFLIDLGSGDGRIIITAAKEYRARGFGVDYDARLVRLATRNAEAEGVTGSVAFYEQDIFKTDLGQATVVTMYLLPEYNAVLKPRLLALRPGTRIVSHDYGIGDWEPDARETVPVPDKPVGAVKESTIYAWVVPARVDGRWRARVQTARGSAELEFDLDQHNQRFSGMAKLRGNSLPIERPYLRSNYLSFRVDTGGETLLFQGHVSNGRITGEQVRSDRHYRWRALKVAASG